MEQSRMDIPEKPAILVRQDTIQIQTKEKQHNMCCTPPCTRHNTKANKTINKTQYVLDTTICKQVIM